MSPQDEKSNSAGTTEMLPQLAISEVSLGRMVGQGGFSIVCKVESIDLNEVFDTGEQEQVQRSDFAASLQENQYVLKTLRTDLPEDEHTKGIVDLAIEAEFLAVLSHPNIISMRAMANSDPHESRFFVILDRLVMTLDRKFNAWRKVVGDNSGVWLGPLIGYCCSKEHFLYETWLERIEAARDIATALYYLHTQEIVYRDLKPDNLGFDASGALKLFDFGLAKRLDPMDRADASNGSSSSLYMLTGNTGSLRYMAPEVARGEPYDQRVDSYSFGILFWQICSLQTPYAGFSTKMHAEQVVKLGERPRPERTWPTAWTDLMARSWSYNMTERPDFDEIAVFLDDQVEELRTNDGEVPTDRVKGKKTKKASVTQRLDVDTRISTKDDITAKRFDNDVV